MSSDHERALVRRALAADERAFRELYDVGFRVAWAYALRSTGSPRAAEAATARALRRAFDALPGLCDGGSGFGAFVVGLTDQALRAIASERSAPEPAARAEGE